MDGEQPLLNNSIASTAHDDATTIPAAATAARAQQALPFRVAATPAALLSNGGNNSTTTNINSMTAPSAQFLAGFSSLTSSLEQLRLRLSHEAMPQPPAHTTATTTTTTTTTPAYDRPDLQHAVELSVDEAPEDHDNENDNDDDDDPDTGDDEADPSTLDDDEAASFAERAGMAQMTDAGGLGGGGGGGALGANGLQGPLATSPPDVTLEIPGLGNLGPFAQWLEGVVPYMLLLLVMFIYEHGYGIILYSWHVSVQFQLNQVVRKQVELREKRQPALLMLVLLILFVHIGTTYTAYPAMWRQLALLMPLLHTKDEVVEPLSFWDAIWLVVITEAMIRFFVMIAKVFCILLSNSTANRKNQSRFFGLLEHTGYCYRLLVPLPVWWVYFQGGSNVVLSRLLACIYAVSKGGRLAASFRELGFAWRSFLTRSLMYGRYATAEEVSEAGGTCSICQETLQEPVLLNCSHLFCEDCICAWFEQRNTCPLCRAQVPGAGKMLQNDGSTSMGMVLF